MSKGDIGPCSKRDGKCQTISDYSLLLCTIRYAPISQSSYVLRATKAVHVRFREPTARGLCVTLRSGYLG